MSDFWFNHLSATLKDNGIVAYMWDMGADRFEWAGDLHHFFGLENHEHPADSIQYNKMLNPQDVPSRLSALHGVLTDEDGEKSSSFTTHYKIRMKNGTSVMVEESATVQQEAGRRLLCGFIRLSEDQSAVKGPATDNIVMTERAKMNYGRTKLQHKIDEWFDNFHTSKVAQGYLLTVGIDRMALFNEILGPRYADEIIEKTGARLQQIIGDAGTACRVDGDVYGLFFAQAPHNEMAAVAKYILNNFYNAPVQTSMGPVGVGVSIGGVTINKSRNRESLITMSEMAMHVAKDKGRSCFVSYDEASSKAEGDRQLLKSADTFLKALKENRLHFAFQPIMGAKDNSTSFHECLMRLMDESGNLIPAGSFIPAIEEMGLSRLVDHHALRMAIQELTMFPDLRLSVNVSNLSLNTQDWLRNLVSALRDRPSVAQRLIVEVTESAVINDPTTLKRIVSTLKDLGCRVALDDFGAGYTAFSQLKDLKVDIVKIDKSFIRNINEEHNHLFVRTLKSLAEGVNIETVGEGAETLAEAQLLANDGIDHIQGYVYGFPRVERLWLPKDHIHRRIETKVQQSQTQDVFHDETAEVLMKWQSTGAA